MKKINISSAILLAFALFMFVYGLNFMTYIANLEPTSTANIIIYLIFLATPMAWVSFHAEEHDLDIGAPTKISMGMFQVVTVPLYFYTNFGFKVGSIKLLKTILYIMSLMLLVGLGSFTEQYINGGV